jgi:putative ABC transport system permease protein
MPRLLLGEGLILGVVGAALGIGLSFAVTFILERVPSMSGVLHSSFTPGAFATALITAIVMTVLGGLYPATRAALLEPLKALSYE